MKFFTPDLINRFGSEDDRIALAAQRVRRTLRRVFAPVA